MGPHACKSSAPPVCHLTGSLSVSHSDTKTQLNKGHTCPLGLQQAQCQGEGQCPRAQAGPVQRGRWGPRTWAWCRRRVAAMLWGHWSHSPGGWEGPWVMGLDPPLSLAKVAIVPAQPVSTSHPISGSHDWLRTGPGGQSGPMRGSPEVSQVTGKGQSCQDLGGLRCKQNPKRKTLG